MARLQILELPEGTGDDRPPFVLVIDQYEPVEATPSRLFRHQDMAEQIGARAVLVFEETIDIPANDLTLSHVQEAADANVVRLRVEPDLDGFTEKVMAEVAKAQAETIDALRQARL
ncbi:hypothetical protein PV405_08815 [Streptomyces sp. ME02-6979-3A]|uniref:hypothetical protein n=1 Tax=Streptomyces sp. ME02-6979-3A TaxID=3028673 RepID=UPI0029B69DA7|nr:hypothetical protein [Streptomyces sp. ME02-6979-3A]MDX3324768.1 hypothetical protein [Streptomyces sp. ME02-6979-3A]